ncbi:MAG: hypothetical protein Kow0029_05230 [Candidatus Rifleibacteriota bacterium]
MAARSRVFLFSMFALLLTLSLSGCNTFEAFDQSLNGTDQDSLISEGNIALNEGRYVDALDFFERSLVAGGVNIDSLRGRASARAGIAGFNMLKTLQVLQNGLIPADSPATIFKAASYVKDKSLVEKAISDLNMISVPEAKDRLMLALLVAIYNCKLLVEKYDTNFNGKLDQNDQIDFDTRDEKTLKWADLYANAVGDTSMFSMEKAFMNLAQGLEGRGENWVFVSPVKGVVYEGIFTPANRNTILALVNFTDSLETANAYFDNSETLFKKTITALDGAE